MPTLPHPRPRAPRWQDFAGAAAICLGAAALAVPLRSALDEASPVLLLLLGVLIAAARFGRAPGVLASVLAVLLFNLLFVEPRFSLAVADARVWFTFVVMLVVGLVVGHLTAGSRAQAAAAEARERRVRGLYEISRELGLALTVEQVAEALARFAQAELGAKALLWNRGDDGRLSAATAPPPDEALAAAAQEAFDRGGPAQVAARSGDGPALVPLRATMAMRGAVAFRRGAAQPFDEDERRLLEACAALLAGALERVHYIVVAQASALEIAEERLRNSVLSTISHDLRTPLAALVGLAESLRFTRPPPSAEQAEIGAALAASARRMASLVDKLLDLARLESGRVRLQRQWQPLDEIVGAALAAAGGALDAHPVSVRLPDALPLVHVDAVLMERVLVNLLENAARHTPPGTAVEIVAGADGPDADGRRASWFAVRDHGPGLPPGREAALFRKFERGREDSTTPGVGLGLALVRSIVEAHGGRVEAGNAAGGGACFTVRLPAAAMPALPGIEDAA